MSTPNPFPSKGNNPKLNTLPRVLANLTGSFLALRDLTRVSTTCKDTLVLFRKPLEDKIAEELLQQVLNANPQKVLAILTSFRPRLDGNSIILKQVRGKEESWSKSQNKMILKRTWNNGISPLEAAAWGGDNFLVKLLLKYLPNKQNLIAAEQLIGIKNRKATDENGGYLAPFKALDNAYKEYLESFEALYAARNWNKLNALWLAMGLYQGYLCTYGLQEFFDEKPHDPTPLFNKEPKRSCLFSDNSEVDIGSLGVNYSLYKVAGAAGVATAAGAWEAMSAKGWDRALFLDAAACRRLCEVRTSELDKIIELLIKPEQAYVENNAPIDASSNMLASSESSEKNSQRCVIS